jgi:hypothetical protein
MNTLVDSTNRKFLDYFGFAAAFLGFLITAAGVVVTSPGLALLGALLIGLSLVVFSYG